MNRTRTWYTQLPKFLSQIVNWHCRPDDDARVVTLTTELDGRPIVQRLTPGEARAVARKLVQEAAWLERTNARQMNGGTYTGEADWAEHVSTVRPLPDMAPMDPEEPEVAFVGLECRECGQRSDWERADGRGLFTGPWDGNHKDATGHNRFYLWTIKRNTARVF
ncbi:hypothetical protein [Streptomyces sp. MNP-20]|uniref:hypothetical protein n=1 Tax=Streptomyces sp. MNP-20 TaxID=2721165 RepID=UPI001556E4FB|nr:hypothetical protein [Streptomyces sp. MNP-20]